MLNYPKIVKGMTLLLVLSIILLSFDSLVSAEKIDLSDAVAQTDDLALFVDDETLSIEIVDKSNGYRWQSSIDNIKNENLNQSWQDFVQSAITIDYITANNKVKRNTLLDKGTKIKIKNQANGFKANITFKSKIKMEIQVKIEGKDLIVTIPNDGIKEPKNAQLYELSLFPFFGSTKFDEVNGYMFIPDGSGALISYQDSVRMDSPYSANVYGNDFSAEQDSLDTESNPAYQVTMPVFGVVHQEKQNAFLANITSGEEYARITAQKAGLSTDFNWITPVFSYRASYKKYVSPNVQSSDVSYQLDRNEMDIVLKYSFLSDEEADYVGMAKTYQSYLKEAGILTTQDLNNPLMQLQFFGAQSKPGVFKDKLVAMTDLEDIREAMNKLSEKELTDFFVVYDGWTKGGLNYSYPNHFPIEKKLGSVADYHDLIDQLQEKEIPFYLNLNYGLAENQPKGIATKQLAEGLDGRIISSEQKDSTYYYLLPESILELSQKEKNEFEKLHVENLAIGQLGSVLYSATNSKESSSNRTQSKEKIMNITEELSDNNQAIALQNPNVYTWMYLNQFLETPMSSSGYTYESRSVPFLQIVLKGHIAYYTPFLNFSANRQEAILKAVDYGAYPSFLLTEEEPILLRNTASDSIYTSQFNNWQEAIEETYAIMDPVKKMTEGQEIVSRKELQTDVFQTIYTNDVSVICNYSNQTVDVMDFEIPAIDFVLVKGGEKIEKDK